jgi:hypothetical protein
MPQIPRRFAVNATDVTATASNGSQHRWRQQQPPCHHRQGNRAGEKGDNKNVEPRPGEKYRREQPMQLLR